MIIVEDIKRISKNDTRKVIVHNSRGFFRLLLGMQKYFVLSSIAILVSLSHLTAFMAFEAHIVDVKAVVADIDAPIISPSGGIFEGVVAVTIDDADPDASHIFYTVTPGTDPGSAADPICGDILGGAKPQGPMDVMPSRVVKAIACDGTDASSHASIVTIAVYELFVPPPPAPLAPLSLDGGEVLGAESAENLGVGPPSEPDRPQIEITLPEAPTLPEITPPAPPELPVAPDAPTLPEIIPSPPPQPTPDITTPENL